LLHRTHFPYTTLCRSSVHRLLNRRSLRHLLLDGLRLAGLSGQVRKLKTARLCGEYRLLLDDFEYVSPVLVKVLVLGLERVDLPLEVLPKLGLREMLVHWADRKSTRLNSSHVKISYAVFCLKKKKKKEK